MSPLMKKIFSLRDITYGWLLIVSILLFVVTVYVDLYNDPSTIQLYTLAGCLLAFFLAVLWGILNYIGHIRMNAMYQKYNDIQAFVNNLALDPDDQLELQTYLEDYASDLVDQGLNKHDAAKQAIQQFKVKEFTTLSKNTMLFNLHAHYYLWGYTCIAAIVTICLFLVTEMVFLSSLVLVVLETTIFLYGLGLCGMFFLYKLFDAMFYKKLTGLKGD
ncbi:hypothetical protein [Alkalihalobacillus sp. AL-G]|uniref:hypothetical protein n=1 Tax=Alkalihalobacillus sp. AL-G TaxID=2926399 RepID=UPI00272BC068|nr:hypothetical protein [Alkalihalobacillus sp. AL-G]WLD94685.1 hypothetical protein MOJ78_07320 [Alkalihalobacillus sp. AL-G]